MTAAPPPPRCWADTESALANGRAIECQAQGTARLGLCPRHDREIGYCSEPIRARGPLAREHSSP